MESFIKVYRIGAIPIPGRTSLANVYIKAEYSADGRLSLTGVEGPKSNGDCLGNAGQIEMHFNIHECQFAPGWSAESVNRLFTIWHRWHLNDMRAHCEHQEKLWPNMYKEVELIHFKTTVAYYKLSKEAQAGKLDASAYEAFTELAKRMDVYTSIRARKFLDEDAQKLIDEGYLAVDRTEKKTLNWLYEYEHPEGVLCKPCPECGYKFGSKWLREEVPEEILQELRAFPDTDVTPAWI